MDLMDRVLQTQFKYIFKAQGLQFSGTIIHQMLLRKTSIDVDQLNFMINGEEVSFGMKEYAIITGLNFGRFPEVDNSGEADVGVPSLIVKYSKRNLVVKVSELEPSFLSCSDKEDAWKLWLICFVCQYLFSLDSKRTVNIKIFRMMENIETFLQFPWGKVSYRATLKDIDKDMKRLLNVYLGKKKEVDGKIARDVAYTIYGFALAFQVWTYEVITMFVPKFAIRTELDSITTKKTWICDSGYSIMFCND